MQNILSIHYKCILSASTHKLSVSEHMFIWTFLLVLVCGNYAQNLSAPLSYTLYKLLGFSPLANYTDRATAACRQS
jgi:hypothetical protein